MYVPVGLTTPQVEKKIHDLSAGGQTNMSQGCNLSAYYSSTEITSL